MTRIPTVEPATGQASTGRKINRRMALRGLGAALATPALTSGAGGTGCLADAAREADRALRTGRGVGFHRPTLGG